MDRYESHTYDVLVVGAGGAGLRAAIEAAAEGCSVGLVCKSLLGTAHTVMAEGGVAAALSPTGATRGASSSFAPRPSCSPPAASAARTRSTRTPGSTPATARRSPTKRAPT